MNNFLRILVFLLCLGNIHFYHAQTLTAGDIAFVGYHTDSNDGFTFITLKDIPSNEVIYFTDKGWNRTDHTWYANTEDHIVWTAPSGGLPIGTVISIMETSSDNLSVSQGSLILNGSGFSMLGGDNIFAYQSTSGVEPANPSFIAGIYGDDNYVHTLLCDNPNGWFNCSTCTHISGDCSIDSGDTSGLPASLINGTDAIALFPNTGEKDNAKYTGTLTGAVSDVRASINNHMNWISSDDPININFSQYSGINITPDEEPTVSLSASSSIALENGGTITLTATLSNTYTSDVSVNLVYSGTAIGSSVDYSAPTSIIVPAGSTSATAIVSIVDDPYDEHDETIVADISTVTNGDEDGVQQVTASILDDDDAPEISINDASAIEGAGILLFTVSLSTASFKTIMVDYFTTEGTATAGEDYISSSGTLTFNPGETTKSINITLTDDTLYETQESFYVNISSPSNATIFDGQGAASIVNNDPLPLVEIYTRSIYNPITHEDGGQAYVIAELNQVSGTSTTIPLAFSGTATGGGIDYSVSGTSITIPPTKLKDSILVTSQFDGLQEGDETIVIDMLSPTNAQEDGVQQVTLSILDEDAVPVPEAPTTPYPLQLFTTGNGTLADLEVNGDNIQWYDAATGGNLLGGTTTLVDATTYYASQTVNGSESNERLAIEVNEICAPSQEVAFGSTVADLGSSPSGSNSVRWFADATGGTELSSTEELTNGIYYVEEYNTSIETLGSGFSIPRGVAVDASGNILVTDYFNDAVKRMDLNGNNIEMLGSGFDGANGIAIDANGNILVTNVFGDPINRMDSNGNNIETLGSEFIHPYGIAVDASGNILVSDVFEDIIIRMDVNGNNIETVGSGFSAPYGVALDASGNILVADTYNAEIKRMDSNGGNIVTLGSGFSYPRGVALDASGNILVADTGNNAIKRMDSNGNNIETLGSDFSVPYGVALDTSGNILVADTGNNAIKRINNTITNRVAVQVNVQAVTSAPTTPYPLQLFTTGNGTLADLEVNGDNIQWYDAATGGNLLDSTTALVDATTYYVSQTINGSESIDRLAIEVNEICVPTQEVAFGSTLADLASSPSSSNSVRWFSDATGGTELSSTEELTSGTYYVEEYNNSIETLGSGFNNPYGVAVDASGNILVADTNNSAIKRMDSEGNNIETLGSGFSYPSGVAVDSNGNILVADNGNNTIKRMDSEGNNIETLGSGFSSPWSVAVDSNGNILVADYGNNAIKRMDSEGNNIETLGSGFSSPWSVAVDSNGNLLVADYGINAIKRMDSEGDNIETLGSGFSNPWSVAVDSNGNILVADYGNNAVKRMDSDGNNIETLGSGFSYPFGVVVDSNGNILVADFGNSAIKRINNTITNRVAVAVNVALPTLAPTTPYPLQLFTTGNGTLADLEVNGDNIQWYDAATGGNLLDSTTALVDATTYYASQTIDGSESIERLAIEVNEICAPSQEVAFGSTVADLASSPSSSNSVRWFTEATGGTELSSTEELTSGTYYVEEYNNSIETLGSGFSYPNGVAIDANGNILVADYLHNTIKRMDSSGNNVETLGSGFDGLTGIAVDASGNILVADTNNHAIKRVDSNGGNMETLGSGFSFPRGIALDASGNILVADYGNGVIKRMDSQGNNIEVLGSGFSDPYEITVDGNGNILVADYEGTLKRMDSEGDNIETLGSGFSNPSGVAVDASGNILVTDSGNNSIKRMDAQGNNIEVLGSGFTYPSDVALDAFGNLLVADSGNSAVKRINTILTNRVAVTVTVQEETVAPTTAYPLQIFTTGNGTLADLEVSGDNIQWYDAATGGNLLDETTALVDATTYYASQTIDGSESIDRLAIEVNEICAPSQEVAFGSTVADLASSPSGNNSVRWFSDATGGTPISATDVLASGTYYVEEFNYTIETLGSGFTNPSSIAIDEAGNILVVDTGSNTVKRMDASGNNIETLASGFSNPGGIAIDGAGNILVADTGSNTIKRMDSNGNTMETLGDSFLLYPYDVTLDQSGHILVSNSGINAITRMDANGSNVSTLNSSFNEPMGISVDVFGNIIIADRGNNAIKRMDSNGINVETLVSEAVFPMGVATDNIGNILFSNEGSGEIKSIDSNGNSLETIAQGLGGPRGIAIDGAGNILVADYSQSIIKRITNITTNRVAVQVAIEGYIYQDNAWTPMQPEGNATGTDNLYVVNGTTSLTADLEVNNVEVMIGASLDIDNVLKVNGDFENNGTVSFKSTATKDGELDEFNGNITGTGSFVVERFNVDQRSYRMLTSSVNSNESIHANWQEGAASSTDNPNQGFGTHITGSTIDQQNGFDGTATGSASMYLVNSQTQGFEAIANTDNTNLVAGQPYFMYIRGDRSIDLTTTTENQGSTSTTLRATGMLATGNQQQQFSINSDGDYVMFGNPYQSSIDMSSVIANSNNVNGAFYYVYDPNVGEFGGYVTYDFSLGSTVPTSDADQYLQPGQGAQIAGNTAGTVTLNFAETDKAPGNHSSTSKMVNNFVGIKAGLYTTENFQNGAYAHDGFVVSFDGSNQITQEDATKPMNIGENLGIIKEGKTLSIEKREMPQADEVIQLFSNNYSSQDYTITMEVTGLTGVTAYFNDSYTGTTTPLNEGMNTISILVDQGIEASMASHRFSIGFESESLGTKEESYFSLSLYPNPTRDGNFSITSTELKDQEVKLTVTDLLGREVISKQVKFNGNSLRVDANEKLTSGVYMINITRGSKTQTIKLIKE